jgi:hypothetical protein
MSKRELDAIENYLLGRIAALDELIRKNATAKTGEGSLPGWRAMKNEDQITLREIRAIRKGGAKK